MVDHSTWNALHDAFAGFCAAEPWLHMGDSEVFGVRDPASEEVGYCCVMGGNGELFGLAVYPGRRGFQCYSDICDEAIRDADLLACRETLLATRADRGELSKFELALIKELQRKYRGRGA